MKILVNATNLIKGGALQVARSLLIEFGKISHEHIITNVVSKELSAVLPNDIPAIVVSPSPARVIAGAASRRELHRIAREMRPDAVLTVFGPAYWRPASFHVCGFADSWVFAANDYCWRSIGFLKRLETKLRCWYKELCMRRENHAIVVVESPALGSAIRDRLGRKIRVVQNNCGQPFFLANKERIFSEIPTIGKVAGEFRIVTLSQYYSHKNLEIIPRVAKALKDRAAGDFRFYLSLREESEGWARIWSLAKHFGVTEQIRTAGIVVPSDAPLFYVGADVMFLPTLLESFSASYPEAMIMRVPIVTTDLPFAREICKGAALYFRPLDAESAAEKILELYCDSRLRDHLIQEGLRRVGEFPTPEQKARQYLEICEELCSGGSNRN